MRRTFNASSLDANLPLRFRGEVHSIFSKAFNIRTEEDELISIVAREKLNGPNRILLKLPKDEDFISIGIREGMRARGTAQEISIGNGNFLISLEEARRWASKVEIEEEISISRIKDNLFSLERNLEEFRKKDRISQALRVRIQELIKSVEERNLSRVSKSTKRLIGFGNGLTPSGDDFLIGFIASLHFLSDSRLTYLLKKIREVIESEKERTTFLSKKFLEYACQGRFPETVLNLIEAIFSGNREGVKEAARRCLDFGATSGRDTLLGIARGLDLIVNSR